MHIIYAVTTCSDRVYRQLFADAPRKPAFQSQKYHRLLIEGLAAGAKVDVVANPPVNREVLKKSFVRLPRAKPRTDVQLLEERRILLLICLKSRKKFLFRDFSMSLPYRGL